MSESSNYSVSLRLAEVRGAQQRWRDVPISQRLEIVRTFRRRLVADRDRLHELHPIPSRTLAQTITSEIIPLASACRWLERHATKTLKDRRLGRWGRPLWLPGVTGHVARDPHGVVLILGTWNYPILLTGVQLLQALVAGNTVLVKPGRDCAALTRRMLTLLGIDDEPEPDNGSKPRLATGPSLTSWPHAVAQLDEEAEAGADAIAQGVDHVVLTGSAATGRAVLRACAKRLTPATVELSGSDAMFVMPGAKKDQVVGALRFGLRFNASATCIAPRRILLAQFGPDGDRVPMGVEQDHLVAAVDTAFVENELLPALSEVKTPTLEAVWNGVDELLSDAREQGAIVHDRRGDLGWVVVDGAKPSMRLTQTDVFAPIVYVIHCYSMSEMIAADRECPYALAASIFGSETEAQAILPTVRAGSITVNDVIAPTADPRIPFGGWGESGFGVTRGPEGLLSMTRPRVVQRNRFPLRPHFDKEHEGDSELFGGCAELLYGDSKWEGFKQMLRGGRRRR